jgi:type IV pilus assembly protein PilE
MFVTFRATRGFTLVELVIALAIAGILTAVAIPSYQQSILKGRRGDAKQELLRLAQAEEKYRVTHTTYGSLADIGGAIASNYYTFEVTASSATGYTITATPGSTGGQEDDDCATLSLTEDATIDSSDPSGCDTP